MCVFTDTCVSESSAVSVVCPAAKNAGCMSRRTDLVVGEKSLMQHKDMCIVLWKEGQGLPVRPGNRDMEHHKVVKYSESSDSTECPYPSHPALSLLQLQVLGFANTGGSMTRTVRSYFQGLHLLSPGLCLRCQLEVFFKLLLSKTRMFCKGEVH